MSHQAQVVGVNSGAKARDVRRPAVTMVVAWPTPKYEIIETALRVVDRPLAIADHSPLATDSTGITLSTSRSALLESSFP